MCPPQRPRARRLPEAPIVHDAIASERLTNAVQASACVEQIASRKSAVHFGMPVAHDVRLPCGQVGMSVLHNAFPGECSVRVLCNDGPAGVGKTPFVTYQGFTNRQLAYKYPWAIAPELRANALVIMRPVVACLASRFDKYLGK